MNTTNTTNAPSGKKSFSLVALAFFVTVIVHQLLVSVINVAVMQIAPSLLSTGWYLWVLSYAPLYLVAFPILLFIVRKLPNYPDPQPQGEFSGRSMALLVISSLGIVLVLNLLSTGLATLIAYLRGTEAINPLAAMLEQSNPLVNVLFVSIIAPIMEEYFFRYVTYKKLGAFGDKAYVIFSSALFALFHMNLYQLLYAFVLGVILALLYLYTGKLRYPIALHLLINFGGSGISTLVMSYLGERATEIWGIVFIVISLAGIVLSFTWLRKQRGKVVLNPGSQPIEKISSVFSNVGMILYMILTGIIIIASLFIT